MIMELITLEKDNPLNHDKKKPPGIRWFFSSQTKGDE